MVTSVATIGMCHCFAVVAGKREGCPIPHHAYSQEKALDFSGCPAPHDAFYINNIQTFNFAFGRAQERWRQRLEDGEAAAQGKLDRARSLIRQYEDTITELSQDASMLTAEAQALREDGSALSAGLEASRAEADALQAWDPFCLFSSGLPRMATISISFQAAASSTLQLGICLHA